ncbi:MAG: hypothetical protein ACJ789_07880 [Thermomicrobiales bacterium]
MTPYQSSGPDLGDAISSDVRWKRWLRRVLLVVSCVCLALAVITLWLRIQIDNTDRYVRTVNPLASNAAIQEAVVASITDRFSARLSVAQTRDTLGDRDRYLAAPLNAVLTNYVEQTARSIVTSEQFQVFWVDARRAIHPRLSAILTGDSTQNMSTADGKVTIDLAPLVTAVSQRLEEQGVDIFARLPRVTVDTTIVVVDSPELASVQGTINRLYKLAVVFPIVVILFLAGYVWLSPNRRRGVLWAGLGVATAMALLLVLLSVARWQYLDRLDSDVNRNAAQAFFDVIGRYLRTSIRLLAVLGLAVAGAAHATRPDGWVRRSIAGHKQPPTEGRHEVSSLGIYRAWAERNRVALTEVLLAIFSICVIGPDRISQTWARAISLAAAIGLALIWLASRSAKPVHSAPPPAINPSEGAVKESAEARDSVIRTGDNGRSSSSEAARAKLIDITHNLSTADLELLGRLAGAFSRNRIINGDAWSLTWVERTMSSRLCRDDEGVEFIGD